MRFPDFLIIGGMKCGSTTLYRDLMTNPQVFFPIDKEPANLCHDHVLTDAGKAEYAAMFAGAKSDQLCAEASTDYTKRPDHEDCAKRAVQVCGQSLRAIYIIRDPIKRLISHHYHEFSRGNMPSDIGQAVRDFPALTSYSMYATQLEPWLDALGPDQIRLVSLEAFTKDRAGHVEALSQFLGITPRPDLVEPDKVFNQGDSKPIMKGRWRAIAGNPAYQKLIRPLLPIGLKDKVRAAVLPKAPPRPAPPSEALERELRERFGEQSAKLRNMVGERCPNFDW